jgi:hypothetical protein
MADIFDFIRIPSEEMQLLDSKVGGPFGMGNDQYRSFEQCLNDGLAHEILTLMRTDVMINEYYLLVTHPHDPDADVSHQELYES